MTPIKGVSCIKTKKGIALFSMNSPYKIGSSNFLSRGRDTYIQAPTIITTKSGMAMLKPTIE